MRAGRQRLAPRRVRASARAWARLLLRHPGYALRLAERRRFVRRVAWAITRATEITIASLLLAALSPLLLAIAVAIRLDSRGSSLFRQVRLGRDAHPFQMYKFRTMRNNADSRPHEQFVREMIDGGLRSGAGTEGQARESSRSIRIRA